MNVIEISIFCLVFIAVSLMTYFLLRRSALLKPEGGFNVNLMYERLSRSQRRLWLGKWADYYDKKIIEAGLSQGNLDGGKILIAKELLFLSMLVLCIMLHIPFILAIWFVVGAFFLPDIYLRDKCNRRKLEIIRSLPDFLDMMTLIVEAGLDFGSALQTVISKSKRNALLDEFDIVLREIRMGLSRAQALKHMAERLKIRDINNLVGAILQSEQLGTSLGAVLQIQANANRERRMQRAEKLALEAPVKMIFPLVFFIFPVVFIVLLGPIIARWLQR